MFTNVLMVAITRLVAELINPEINQRTGRE